MKQIFSICVVTIISMSHIWKQGGWFLFYFLATPIPSVQGHWLFKRGSRSVQRASKNHKFSIRLDVLSKNFWKYFRYLWPEIIEGRTEPKQTCQVVLCCLTSITYWRNCRIKSALFSLRVVQSLYDLVSIYILHWLSWKNSIF